jgi:hypothetical protein
MPRMFLRCSFAALTAIALIAVFAGGSAQAQKWSVQAGSLSNRPMLNYSNQSKALVGRNDGYVQQSTQGGTRQSLQGRTTKKGSDAIRSTPAVQLNRFSN